MKEVRVVVVNSLADLPKAMEEIRKAEADNLKAQVAEQKVSGSTDGEKCCTKEPEQMSMDVGKPTSSFEAACRPLIKWLAESVHPHHTAVVTSTGAELFEGQRNTGVITDYLRD